MRIVPVGGANYGSQTYRNRIGVSKPGTIVEVWAGLRQRRSFAQHSSNRTNEHKRGTVLSIIIAVALMIAGVVLILRATREVAEINVGHDLPLVFGSFAKRPSKRTVIRRSIGFLLVLLGAWRASAIVWNHAPGWSLLLLPVLVVLGWTVPALLSPSTTIETTDRTQ
ncbi:hypothetical protein [Rhodococcus sp. IEGM 1374]|uniref:hypothetical protein n=1 Tax=Rhodococcus sp. IEGM 1374 TaxID=3082221 RepID=UPI002954ED34|nr:hypothetical protein [Rhodococcus sp. IEGM 1374]MDV7991626.1 hypothetical protein [Rhodococcus sp. IEGM 1374]